MPDNLEDYAILMCDVKTEVYGHNIMLWQDIVDAVEFGNYEIVA